MMYVRCIYTAMSSMQTICQTYKQKGKHIGQYGLIYVKVSTMQSAFEKCLLVFAIKSRRVLAVSIALCSTAQHAFQQYILLFSLPHKTRSSSVYCSLFDHTRRVRAVSIALCSTTEDAFEHCLLFFALHTRRIRALSIALCSTTQDT